MLSKNKIKFIHSLERKKIRDEYGLFIAEGNKIVSEAFQSDFEIETLVCTEDFYNGISSKKELVKELIITTNSLIRKASLLQNPQDAIAIIKKPYNPSQNIDLKEKLCLALDCIQDPGNLGTILRIADWFGIENIVCSNDTVDAFNPKVVQASMGAIFRVKTFYTELQEYVQKEIEQNTHVYGTFLDGTDIYKHELTKSGLMVMGNEGKGISPEIDKLIKNRISIPSFAKENSGSESLNVAVATAICCSEFRRR